VVRRLQFRCLVDRVNSGNRSQLNENVSNVTFDGPRTRLLTNVREALPRNSEYNPVSIGTHGADRNYQLLPVHALEQVSSDTSRQQILDELRPLVHAQYDHLRAG
jgi:hypothetical protein